jgi:ABC-type sugar transport system ATPase subunit
MIEELIRVDHGIFTYADTQYLIDLAISRGECVGIFVDNHRTSGTACMRLFTGQTRIESGTVFAGGVRIGYQELYRWIRENTAVVNRDRFMSGELTAGDFVCAMRGGRSSSASGLLRVREERLRGETVEKMRGRMGIAFPWETPLPELSMLDYYRLAVFQAWMAGRKLIVLDRITEILRRQDLDQFMECIMVVLEQGTAVYLLDLDENFMFRYASRIDVMKNRRLVWHLVPEEYGDKLYQVLGWRRDRGGEAGSQHREGQTASEERAAEGRFSTEENRKRSLPERSFSAEENRKRSLPERIDTNRFGYKAEDQVLLKVSDLTFAELAPMNFRLDRGEIGILQDENYRTGATIRACFLGDGRAGQATGWQRGTFMLDGRAYTHRELQKMVGGQIAVQIEMPDRSGGVLFDNLTALENLSSSLIPKAGKHIIRKPLVDSILREASEWFDRDALLQPISSWPMPERLRLSYYKWYLLNPKLLICLFPFLGQESIHHEMILDLILRCAKRGMGIWIVSSGISEIREKSGSRDFLDRLRYLD